MKKTRLLLLLAWSTIAASAVGSEPIPLPPPQTNGGRPLMQALKERRSGREFRPDPIPAQTLANLLWAGFGVNRATNGHRTAPSAMNAQEIDLYVVTAEGAFLYEAKAHALQPVARGDLRARTGSQPFVKDAPLALLFVADLARLSKARPEDRERYAALDTGYISQNIYLFCASEGLATVAHELDRRGLDQTLGLRPDQQIILAQSVGFPKEPSSNSGGHR